MIKRIIEDNIHQIENNKKAIVIMGARQVGKSTLIDQIVVGKKVLYLTGDDPDNRVQFSNPTKQYLLNFVNGYDAIVIDEAQRFENIGLTVKMLVDAKLDKQIIVSGSSSLDLANKINEPLTGRKWEFQLYPFSWKEIADHYTFATTIQNLEELLIYGQYPEVVVAKKQKAQIIKSIAGSYLYKDILELVNIKKPDLLLKILKALALQLGSEVSYNELSNTIGADRQTIINYIDLLEKCFVIHKLLPYHTNQRKELTSKPKIYFYDLGIRNAIIGNFLPLNNRQDVGALWENFFINERMKKLHYEGFYGSTYYWRNTEQKEIDYIEVQDDEINIYEMKWSANAKAKISKSFTSLYNPKSINIIHKENFWQYL